MQESSELVCIIVNGLVHSALTAATASSNTSPLGTQRVTEAPMAFEAFPPTAMYRPTSANVLRTQGGAARHDAYGKPFGPGQLSVVAAAATSMST